MSMYSRPSMSVKRAPLACVTYTGFPSPMLSRVEAQTPPGSTPLACSNSLSLLTPRLPG
jgi:hypothetical protein